MTPQTETKMKAVDNVYVCIEQKYWNRFKKRVADLEKDSGVMDTIINNQMDRLDKLEKRMDEVQELLT